MKIMDLFQTCFPNAPMKTHISNIQQRTNSVKLLSPNYDDLYGERLHLRLILLPRGKRTQLKIPKLSSHHNLLERLDSQRSLLSFSITHKDIFMNQHIVTMTGERRKQITI
jgi:hypothetical protein